MTIEERINSKKWMQYDVECLLRTHTKEEIKESLEKLKGTKHFGKYWEAILKELNQ